MSDRRIKTRAPGPILSPRPRQTFNQPYPPSPGYRQSQFNTNPYPPHSSPFHRHAHQQARPPFFPAHPFAPGMHRGPASPFMRPPPLSPFTPHNRPIPFNFPIPMPVPVFVLPIPVHMNDHGAYQEDAAETLNRQRAYPPRGPRVFPSSSGNINVPQPQSRKARVEVHHPDGTVEYRDEDEPTIEEMENEAEELERKDWNEVSHESIRGEILQLEWKGARSGGVGLASHNPSRDLAYQETLNPTGPTPVLRKANEVPTPEPTHDISKQVHVSTPAIQTPKVISRPESDAYEAIEASRGSRVCVEREMSENHEPSSSSQTGSMSVREIAQIREEPLLQPDLNLHGASSTIEKTVRIDTPAEYRQRVATPDEARDLTPGIFLTETQGYPVEESNPCTPPQAQRSVVSSPSSAGLPSPSPAQVMDRLLEVTGLSARQFMGMVDRGEFHIGQAKK